MLAFVRAMVGISRGREDDEHTLPPGPWDPVIRSALERIHIFGMPPRFNPHHYYHPHPHPDPEPWPIQPVFGPQPEPWKVILASIFAKYPAIWDAIGGGGRFGEEVALNPQPLPPRFAFLISVAQVVISRAELFQEILDAAPREGQQQGMSIVSGYISRFSDDWCGNDFRLRWPFPDPHPHPRWFTKELDGIDLLVIATRFEQAAKEAYSPDLRQSLANVGARLVETGLAKMR